MERHFFIILEHTLNFAKISSFAKEIGQLVFISQNRAMSPRLGTSSGNRGSRCKPHHNGQVIKIGSGLEVGQHSK